MTKRDISCDTRLLPNDTSLSLFFTHGAHLTEALILVTEQEPEPGTSSGVQAMLWAGGEGAGGIRTGLFPNVQMQADGLKGDRNGIVRMLRDTVPTGFSVPP